jgi:hypothetical protein
MTSLHKIRSRDSVHYEVFCMTVSSWTHTRDIFKSFLYVISICCTINQYMSQHTCGCSPSISMHFSHQVNQISDCSVLIICSQTAQWYCDSIVSGICRFKPAPLSYPSPKQTKCNHVGICLKNTRLSQHFPTPGLQWFGAALSWGKITLHSSTSGCFWCKAGYTLFCNNAT